MASPDFKFGAKIRMFGEHEINIKPNPERPMRIEYHDEQGIGVTKEFISRKLKITDQTIKDMIPENTRVTDLIYDRGTSEFEVGIVVNPGDDFILNRYKDIVEIQEVSMLYRYDPEASDEATTEETEAAEAEEVIDEANIDDEMPVEDDMMEADPMEDEEFPLEEDELPEE